MSHPSPCNPISPRPSTPLTPLTVLAALGVTALAGAQGTLAPRPIRSPIRDAGVYHVATGTWSRGTDAALGFGPKTLYSNTANTGYFGLHDAGTFWHSSLRIPSAGDPSLPNVSANHYVVDGFQFGYCNSEGPAGVGLHVRLYEKYVTCTDPTLFTPALAATITGLPGGSAAGVTACWIVTVDLAGTSLTTAIEGEGGDGYQGILDQDSAGFAFGFVSTAGGYAGPFLNGDPRNFPYGDGTYYQNPTAASATGLGIQDQFYLFDVGGLGWPNGCFWFGGYRSGNPFAAWWVELYGDTDPDEPCTSVCQSNPSSAGAGARIEGSHAGGTLELSAAPVPDQPGIFFHAPSSIRVPFGNGFLCAGGGIVRLLPPALASGGTATRSVDASGLSGVRYFQYWFRDPAGGGAFFNTSDAVCCDFGS